MSSGPTPIFLLGILERSGTNFLWDLFRAHPDCGVRRPIWEDKLLGPAHMLEQYVDTVVATWDENWLAPAEERGKLMRALGDGLVSWVTSAAEPLQSHVIVKTPSVENLPLFDDLFGDEVKLLILIRDGRSVVESGVRSFGWSYPLVMKKWADAARTILTAQQMFAETGRRYHLVRYEDVLADQRGQLTEIFTFCGLDPTRFDFEAAEAMPVRGSSTERVEAGAPVDWAKVERPDDFAPQRRHVGWDDGLRHLYAEIAGDASVALGYPLEPLPPLTPAVRGSLVCYRAELAAKLGQRQVRLLRGRALRAAARSRRRR
ncbi:MAG: protein-tyrosine sulfotransferase [Frankiales bacterium]|jgi:hypothetical protein|nr:protein-tyrosine sulfotransferase [Frankiales bacterium]